MCYLLFVNGLFVLFALWMFSVGIIIQTTLHGTYGLFGSNIVIPSSLIVLGFLLVTTSLIALLGIFYKSSCALSVYFYLLILLVIAELSVGISGFVFKPHMQSLIIDSMRSTEAKYTEDNLIKETWDFIQENMQCCGVHTHTEWFRYLGEPHLPDSCCAFKVVGCGRTAAPVRNFQKTPCSNVIFRWAYQHEIVAAVFFGLIVVLQIGSVVCAKLHQRAIVCNAIHQVKPATRS